MKYPKGTPKDGLQPVVKFQMNDYLTTNGTCPYPMLNEKVNEITPDGFKNVMDYGAKGDGKTYDDAAIVATMAAAQKANTGVIFPEGRIFCVKGNPNKTTMLNKSITFWAYGATIRMGDLCKYSWIPLSFGSSKGDFIWLGGTMDGNQAAQQYPSNPRGGVFAPDNYIEGGGNFLQVSNANFALFKDIELLNIVVTGLNATNTKIAVFADCTADGGANLQYGSHSRQGTYFKARGTKSNPGQAGALYCQNLQCNNGSIGVQYSTPNFTTHQESVSVLVNVNCDDCSQNPLHFEDSANIFLYNCNLTRKTQGYGSGVQISNQTEICSVKNCKLTNVRLNFNQASKQVFALTANNTFTSTGIPIDFLLDGSGRQLISVNNNFKGSAKTAQCAARHVQYCSFTDFGTLGIYANETCDHCYFDTGNQAVASTKDGFVTPNCTFVNVKQTPRTKNPPAAAWDAIFQSTIKIVDQDGNALGTINTADVNCDYVAGGRDYEEETKCKVWNVIEKGRDKMTIAETYHFLTELSEDAKEAAEAVVYEEDEEGLFIEV